MYFKIAYLLLIYLFIRLETNVYWTIKEGYIKFSFKLRIFYVNIVKEYIVIYNHKCVMVNMTCRSAQ